MPKKTPQCHLVKRHCRKSPGMKSGGNCTRDGVKGYAVRPFRRPRAVCAADTIAKAFRSYKQSSSEKSKKSKKSKRKSNAMNRGKFYYELSKKRKKKKSKK